MLGRLKKPNPLAPARQVVASPARLESEGHLALGHAGDRTRSIPLGSLASHLVVTGQPGMGKTTLVCDLVCQLAEQGLNVVVFEPAKVEYASLLAGRGLVVTTYGEDGLAGTRDIRVNPYAIDEGIKGRVWLQDLSRMVQDSYGMREQPLPTHLEALARRAYREAGTDLNAFARVGDRFPTVKDVLLCVGPYVDEETCSGAEVSQNVKGALMHRARAMCQLPSLLTPKGLMVEDLMDFGGGAKVFQLSDLGPEDGAFVGMVLLGRIIRKSRVLGSRPLHTVVVLEEAHSLLIDPLTGEPTLFSRLYEQALAELRSAGIGFITVEQRPSLLPAGVFANSVTKVAFASTHGDDRDAVKRAFGLDEDQARRFGSLRVGEALCHAADGQGASILSTR